MKTILKTLTFATAVAALASCGNADSNNASHAADSANASTIAATDSANRQQIAMIDSAKDKLDSTHKADVETKEDAAKFLVKAYESGMYEVELAQLAVKQSANVEVKKLATHLVTAHKDINTKMQKIALDGNYKLPGGIDSDHAKAEGDLSKLTGAEFDKKFMEIIKSGHEKSVETYEDAAKGLGAGATKSFATATLPMIKSHLDMIQKMK
ncbi:DUF4142 domain-containing protein [Mucilaginibacter myungsuensis]|uniref:DUF4142 domain-containing protein n=1 Tax=Mucilaginibacter myungsuensis TaxID=649104 RepID=A0A929KWB5_9SPHI|nr:DUF4142 domain-containing protein [Mucilaginibacter myungsuensis]MBE9661633.1 DUF4142 domain-containing protein [Mucilaginibacter myungsuensis]MDN3597777.1 DUF4142 domain-containing protein [Mucilaginibacter myungsuensis]